MKSELVNQQVRAEQRDRGQADGDDNQHQIIKADRAFTFP